MDLYGLPLVITTVERHGHPPHRTDAILHGIIDRPAAGLVDIFLCGCRKPYPLLMFVLVLFIQYVSLQPFVVIMSVLVPYFQFVGCSGFGLSLVMN